MTAVELLVSDWTRAPASQLAAASMRLVPSDATRVLLGLAFHSEDLRTSSLAWFRQVLSSSKSALMRSWASESIGMVHSRDGEHRKALASYDEACEEFAEKPRSWLWSAAMAIQCNMLSAARDRLLQADSVSAPEELVGGVVDCMVNSRAIGEWAPTPEGVVLARNLGSEVPERMKGVCDAFLAPSV